MVRHNSLLGQALEAQRVLGEQLPLYGTPLAKIAASDLAGPEFDKVVARANPASSYELTYRLLELVVMTALEAPMGARRDGERESRVARNRAVTEARYERWFDALDVLAGAFGVPDVRILPPPEDTPRPRPVPTGKSRLVPNDCPVSRFAAEAWHVALGHGEPTSDDPRAVAWRNHVRFRTKIAPDWLRDMRKHLATRRAGELAVLDQFPHGRNQGSGADRMAFTIMLSRRLRTMVGRPQLEFVTTMTDILFGDGNSVYTLEGTRRLLSREAKRRAPGRS